MAVNWKSFIHIQRKTVVPGALCVAKGHIIMDGPTIKLDNTYSCCCLTDRPIHRKIGLAVDSTSKQGAGTCVKVQFCVEAAFCCLPLS